MFSFLQPKVPTVSSEELKRAIEAKESFVLLDVRTQGEYVRGKISGSINIPLDKITCDIFETVPDKNKKLYVYCLSGSRSAHAVDALAKLGYTNVFDVAQGLLAWRAKGFPVKE